MLKNRKIMLQSLMLWFLPLIVIGGLFIPVLGYIVFLMMIFFLILAYFKGRFWCANLCPRGSFLDLILSKFSLRNKIPKIFLSQTFKWVFFIVFMAFFASQLMLAPKNVFSIGFVFVKMCLITTIIAVLLGLPFRERTWCVICPMGTLQAKIGSVKQMPKEQEAKAGQQKIGPAR